MLGRVGGKGGEAQDGQDGRLGWADVARCTELPIGPMCQRPRRLDPRTPPSATPRGSYRRLGPQAGRRRRRPGSHQLRDAHAVRDGAQMGSRCRSSSASSRNTHLGGSTSIDLRGVDAREIVDTVHHRRPPAIPVSDTMDHGGGVRRCEPDSCNRRRRRREASRGAVRRSALRGVQMRRHAASY